MQVNKSWNGFVSDIEKLIDMMGDYRPDVIVPVMRGGLVPGAILAERLGVMDVRPISIERVGDKRRVDYDIQGDISGLKLLLVEDDLPTGKGPVYVKGLYEEKGADVKIASVYVNPVSKEVVDFYGQSFDTLPNLPWKPTRARDRKIE